MIRIVHALWPGTLAVLCFTTLSAAAFDRTKNATRDFAPQIDLATPYSSSKSQVRKRRLREAAPQFSTKRGCPGQKGACHCHVCPCVWRFCRPGAYAKRWQCSGCKSREIDGGFERQDHEIRSAKN